MCLLIVFTFIVDARGYTGVDKTAGYSPWNAGVAGVFTGCSDTSSLTCSTTGPVTVGVLITGIHLPTGVSLVTGWVTGVTTCGATG